MEMIEEQIFTPLRNKVTQGRRISLQEAELLYQRASDEQLQELALIVRSRFHPEKEASWTRMCIINFTNICIAKCDFCAFYRLPHQEGTYTLTAEELVRSVEIFHQGGDGYIGFNGGFNPKLSLATYREVFGEVRRRFPDMVLYEMTIPEFMFYCKLSKVPYEEGAAYLKASGTAWIPGGGAEVLSPSFRLRHSPGKYTVDDYFQAQAAVIRQGIGSTATMMIGMDESPRERFEHLERLRHFQDLWKKMPSFLCWTYKPWNTSFGGQEISDQDYLRWLAICRIFLDNFKHIRTSVLTRHEVALHGLRYGADDLDLPTSDEVISKAGGEIPTDHKKILDHGRKLGYSLKRRAASLAQPS
ncbi:MAG: radical SAM protein [Deltaproteobacteria bacterium]|nr:radical SAM protein [Deltaproteobacteria bacterium]